MRTKRKIIPDYKKSIAQGRSVADNFIPNAKLFISNLCIGNSGINGEPDGKRLGSYTKKTDGFADITLSETILSEWYPFMDEEIVATIIHEYAHVASTIYAYNSDPSRMFLSLLRCNQRYIECSYIEKFYEEHKDTEFARYISDKREGEDVPSELISEAFESVYRNDHHYDDALPIYKDYMKVLTIKPKIPIGLFWFLLHLRNTLYTVLILPTVLITTLYSLLGVCMLFTLFRALMDFLSLTI